MKKREFICAVTALIMILSGVSCGSSDGGSSYAGESPAGGERNAAPSPGLAAGETFAGDTNGEKAAAEDEPSGKTTGAMAEDTAEAADVGGGGDGDMKEFAAEGEALMSPDGAAMAEPMTGGDSYKETASAGSAVKGAASAEGGAVYDGERNTAADFAEGEADDAGTGETAAADEPLITTTTPAATTTAADLSEPEVTESSEPEEKEVDLPEAGLLTAGEWNDNDNWGFFSNLVNAGTIKFPAFGLDPTNRTAVTVKDKDGKPIVNAKVVLTDGGKESWHAVTDKNGTAYLFGDGDKVEVTSDGKTQSYELAERKKDEQGNSAGGGENAFVFDGGDKLYSDTEVMFIVDTTGSMSDEMLFLQSEFSAITRAVGTDGIKYAVSFYRDDGDDYVTKHSGFSSDTSEIQRTLNNESADGGGDYPEAVAQVLTECITEGEWSEESAKVAFLIFDAPPHDGKEDELLAAAVAAGKKGIHIVPVVSSDSDRDTELFARALAIMSGGTYVFLTDDSGIGNSHMEPIIGDYEVEKLYDIIIRVINNYKQS